MNYVMIFGHYIRILKFEGPKKDGPQPRGRNCPKKFAPPIFSHQIHQSSVSANKVNLDTKIAREVFFDTRGSTLHYSLMTDLYDPG